MSTLQYVQPTEEQKATMQEFRDKYEALFNELKSLPASRGMSLALTKLEESAMWLNKAITKNDQSFAGKDNLCPYQEKTMRKLYKTFKFCVHWWNAHPNETCNWVNNFWRF